MHPLLRLCALLALLLGACDSRVASRPSDAGRDASSATMAFGIGVGVHVGGSGAGASAPSATPTISSVSQNAGTTNGGTTLSLVGTNFAAGMTSALGALSAITATTATLTTGAHAAGAVSWTVTVSGHSASNQTYTYLAAPGTPSSNPTAGPTGSTQAATFTSTNLPFGFSGVPFSITVGGNAVTGLSATAITTATGTIPTHAEGAADIVVTVDGVSTTASGAYTFESQPTIASVSQNGGTLDGSTAVAVTGAHFFAGMTSTLGTVSAITSTTATITTNAASAGAFSWTVSTPGGGASASQSYTYLAHPGVPSASPNSGPTNATTSATFTSSGLPSGLSGVPFTVTVGGASVTGLSASSSTTATGTIPSGGTTGAQDIVVTVDGKSATGTGAFTFVPTITSCTNCFGSAGGQTPATAAKPSIAGAGLTSCTSISLAGTAHSSSNFTCSGGTSCTINTILAGTAAAFGTITATCNGATSASFGNGTSTGFTYVPASYHLYIPDYVAFGTGSAVQSMTDLGDLTANTPTQNTGAKQPTQVTGGSGINNRAAISFATTLDLTMTSLASLTAGEMFIVSKYGASGSPSIVMGSNGGSFIPHSDSHIYDDFGVTTRALNGVAISGGFSATATWLYEAAVTSGGSWQSWINGTSQGTASGKTVSFTGSPTLGTASVGGATFLMGAFLLYPNTTLSTGNRSVIKTWLCASTWYGLTCT